MSLRLLDRKIILIFGPDDAQTAHLDLTTRYVNCFCDLEWWTCCAQQYPTFTRVTRTSESVALATTFHSVVFL